MARSTKAQGYSNFIGLDASSDPRTVARNRLAYSVNMWRDYESEQGAAIETFPGFRRVVHSLGIDSAGGEKAKVHGLYQFRSRRGIDYIAVHAGTKIYAFEAEALAKGDYSEITSRSSLLAGDVSDNGSTGFVSNNNLYIVDGHKIFYIYDSGTSSPEIKAEQINPYVPTTFYNGNALEQRNMLCMEVRQVETGEGTMVKDVPLRSLKWYDILGCDININDEEVDGYSNFNGVYEDGYVKLNLEPNASNFVCIPDAVTKYASYFVIKNLGNNSNLNYVYIFQNQGAFKTGVAEGRKGIELSSRVFEKCEKLKAVYLQFSWCNNYLRISADAFVGCDSLTDIYVYVPKDADGNDVFHYEIADGAIPNGVTLHKIYEEPPTSMKKFAESSLTLTSENFDVKYSICEPCKSIKGVSVIGATDNIHYVLCREEEKLGDETVEIVKYIGFVASDVENKKITIELEIYPNHFAKIENMTSFQEADVGYKKTSGEAILGCTKCAVYDGRVFLTGNPDLPNTVFYSQRNNTGANDPTYFGIYNYFNDGIGNTPNVDMLATPSMLMVIKGDTVQDGSVYYHVGTYNADEDSKGLLPRIYPSTQGAAGFGSAGDATPSQLSCNFFDDPVFISRRGVEGVSKEAVNLERTIQHRSSNIDRLLIRENLANASLAEWKKYLVICCDGHMYLADSRYMIQHSDGSLQYEWYYLEGVGTYERYDPRWEYLDGVYPYVDDNYTLDEYIVSGERIGDVYKLRTDDAELTTGAEIMHVLASAPDGSNDVDLYFVIEDGEKYIVVANGEEKRGVGQFFGATRIIAVGDRLIFGTDNGDVCIVNTDMRGVSVDERAVDYDRIDRSFYSFNGVPYLSGCATRLDDCDQKFFSKNTVCGTTVARFKMMPGSHCKAMVSTNGRDWEKLGEAGSSRFDFADIDFANMSFAENENNVVVFPEISRGWVNKQYYFYSDRFEAPFGLYELSYLWYATGKIRY